MKRHNSRSLVYALVLLMLLLLTVPLVGCGGSDGTHLSGSRVVVVNQDEGYAIPPSRVRVTISGAIIANLDSDVVEVDEVATEAEGVRLVESGDAYGLIVFPKDLTKNVYEKLLDPSLSPDTTIRLRLDETNASLDCAVKEAVGNALLEALAAMGLEGGISIDTGDAI